MRIVKKNYDFFMDFFKDRDGLWWFWFVFVSIVLGSGLISRITGIGWDDPDTGRGLCEGLDGVAWERCMEPPVRGDYP